MFGTTSIFGSQTSAPSLFGTTTVTTSAAPTFGGFGTTTASGFGGFGTGTSTLAGTGTAVGGTSLFGGTTQNTTTGLFGQNQATQNQAITNQQQTASTLAQMAAAISAPQIFNDERDSIIAKWNQIQAFWGTGKGCYSQSGAVDFKPDNPFCRFKAVGYSCLPQSQDSDGLVSITIDQPHDDVRKVQQQFLDGLQKIIGNQQTLPVCMQGLRPLPDNKTELIIYILERPTSGPSRKIPASDLIRAFSQPTVKSQLMTGLKITEILPKTAMTPDQLKLYLDIPPAGIDPLLWQQAKLDNPNPERLIPVPMIGFTELNQRLKHQEQQTKLHQNRLDIIAQEFSKCQINHTNMLSKLEEYKHKQLELGHRLLKVIVRQEVVRKLGYAIQADEEQLRSQLETAQSELNHPTQFKGRLNELMSQMRLQNQSSSSTSDVSYQIDASLQNEIRQLLKQQHHCMQVLQHLIIQDDGSQYQQPASQTGTLLKQQQQGLQHLISVIQEDSTDLKTIESGLLASTRQ